jgi:hypothetical protein
MLGSSWVAAQLAAPQEGLSSMKLVSLSLTFVVVTWMLRGVHATRVAYWRRLRLLIAPRRGFVFYANECNVIWTVRSRLCEWHLVIIFHGDDDKMRSSRRTVWEQCWGQGFVAYSDVRIGQYWYVRLQRNDPPHMETSVKGRQEKVCENYVRQAAP